MLITIKELTDRLDSEYYDEEYSIIRTRLPMSNIARIKPQKYSGLYERVGYASIWNRVGMIEKEYDMYKPIEGGTLLYEID